MSRQNVEIVKASIDAYNHEDWDAMLEASAPDFEWTGRGHWVSGVVFTDLIRFEDSSWNSPRAGNPFGLSPTNSSRPGIS
jgi:hypothetical protein